MIKRTLCFSNPAYLSLSNEQLVIKLQEPEPRTVTIPIEDIGVVVLDHQQISITHGALSALVQNNAAVITCDSRHLPTGLLMPLDGNTVQSERFADQIGASLPLKKQLWQQTVSQKILNQAAILNETTGSEVRCMLEWAKKVKSGDSDNLEGRAAAYYWNRMFEKQWTRDKEGDWPNPLFNYGYAILRAIVARALVSSGMLPTLGIHHHNKYNAYCLADDIMEPYRPYVDRKVMQMLPQWPEAEEITTEMKRMLLEIPVMEVKIDGKRSPLMVAVSMTTASLYRCFCGEQRKIVYPTIESKWTVLANTESCG